jgi:hypothetical protein
MIHQSINNTYTGFNMNGNKVTTGASAVGIEAVRELERARALYAPMSGTHDGYSKILEEVDELWAEIKAFKDYKDASKRGHQQYQQLLDMRGEALQIAAMAMRFVMDVCDSRLEEEDRT